MVVVGHFNNVLHLHEHQNKGGMLLHIGDNCVQRDSPVVTAPDFQGAALPMSGEAQQSASLVSLL